MRTKVQTRLLYVGDEENITDLMAAILTKKVESVLSAYDADMGYLIFRVAKPEIVITNIKNRLYSNEKLAAQIKELDNETTVICICDKLESQQYTSNKNIDIVLEEPLEVGVLLDIVKGKTNLLR